ncbi:cupin domain-containing protein [Streptomyces sp. L7]
MADERFILLAPGAARPGRIPLPPAFRVKATTGDTDGRFSLMEVVLDRDIPRHTHHRADEGVYVLDGVLEIEFDNAVHLAPRGLVRAAPPRRRTALRSASDPPPRVLQISSPGGWEHYLEDLFGAGPTVLTDGRLDPAKINPIAARYDIAYEETPQDHG